METTANEVTEISCELISYIGSAKSYFVEALRCANRGDVQGAKKALEEGRADYTTAYKSHTKLLDMFSNGIEVKVDLLLLHAECSLMSTEDFKALAEEALDLLEERLAQQ